MKLANIFKKIFPSTNDREVKKLQATAARVTDLEDQFRAMNDESLRAFTQTLRERRAAGEELDALLPEAFAPTTATSLGSAIYKPTFRMSIRKTRFRHGFAADDGLSEGLLLIFTVFYFE